VHCAGLRVSFLLTPDQEPGGLVAAALRATVQMSAFLMVALVARWLADGSADAMIDAIRGEAAARQRLAADVLAGHASGLRRWCLIYGRAADGGEGTDRLHGLSKAAAVYKARACKPD